MMNIIYHGYLEMMKAWYDSGKERAQGKEQMESEGWNVYEEYLSDNKVYVTFVREVEIEE